MIEVRQFDQNVIRVDGSRRVTLRNRKHLKKIKPIVQRGHLAYIPGLPQPTTHVPIQLNSNDKIIQPTALDISFPTDPAAEQSDDPVTADRPSDTKVHQTQPNTTPPSALTSRSCRARRPPARLIEEIKYLFSPLYY